MAKQSVRLPVPQFIPRYRVTLVSEGGHTAPYGVLRDSAAAAAALRPYFAGLDREQFLVCCLDAKNASIGVNIVSIGSLTLSIVHPREVFKPAILLNACAILAVHNLCGALHKLCYVTFRIMWSSCTLTRLRLPETCEFTVSSCT
jgi:DNA repair protein RadC